MPDSGVHCDTWDGHDLGLQAYRLGNQESFLAAEESRNEHEFSRRHFGGDTGSPSRRPAFVSTQLPYPGP